MHAGIGGFSCGYAGIAWGCRLAAYRAWKLSIAPPNCSATVPSFDPSSDTFCCHSHSWKSSRKRIQIKFIFSLNMDLYMSHSINMISCVYQEIDDLSQSMLNDYCTCRDMQVLRDASKCSCCQVPNRWWASLAEDALCSNMFNKHQHVSISVQFKHVQTTHCSSHFIPIPRPTLPSHLAHTVPSEKASALTMEWGTLVVFTCSKDLEQCRMCRWCIWRQELWALWTGDVWCLILTYICPNLVEPGCIVALWNFRFRWSRHFLFHTRLALCALGRNKKNMLNWA